MGFHTKTAIICGIFISFLYPGSFSQIYTLTVPGMPVNESSGYVVLINGDTLPGFIKWRLRYVENNLAEISFTSQNGSSKIYPAGDILAFGYNCYYDKYESVPSLKKGIPVYLYRFLDGRIKIFLNRTTGKPLGQKSAFTTGLFSFDPIRGLILGENQIPGSVFNLCADARNFLVRKDKGELRKIDKENYPEVFAELFSDCPEIIQESEKYPEMKVFDNFVIITAVYNMLYHDP